MRKIWILLEQAKTVCCKSDLKTSKKNQLFIMCLFGVYFPIITFFQIEIKHRISLLFKFRTEFCFPEFLSSIYGAHWMVFFRIPFDFVTVKEFFAFCFRFLYRMCWCTVRFIVTVLYMVVVFPKYSLLYFVGWFIFAIAVFPINR